MILQATTQDIVTFAGLVRYSPSANFKGIKLIRNGLIRAMVGYDHWTPNSVQMHICIVDKKAITKDFIKEGFKYPFITGGRGVVIGCTPADNEEALEFNRRLGFRETYRVKDGWEEGVDVVIQEMRREECKWVASLFN